MVLAENMMGTQRMNGCCNVLLTAIVVDVKRMRGEIFLKQINCLLNANIYEYNVIPDLSSHERGKDV